MGNCPKCDYSFEDGDAPEVCPQCGQSLVGEGMDDTIDFEGTRAAWAGDDDATNDSPPKEDSKEVEFDLPGPQGDSSSDGAGDPALNIGAPDPDQKSVDQERQTVDFIAANNPLLTPKEEEDDGEATVEMEDPNSTVDFGPGEATVDYDSESDDFDTEDEHGTLVEDLEEEDDPNSTVDFGPGEATVDLDADSNEFEIDVDDGTIVDESEDDDPNSTVDIGPGEATVEFDAADEADMEFDDDGTISGDPAQADDPNATVEFENEITVDMEAEGYTSGQTLDIDTGDDGDFELAGHESAPKSHDAGSAAIPDGQATIDGAASAESADDEDFEVDEIEAGGDADDGDTVAIDSLGLDDELVSDGESTVDVPADNAGPAAGDEISTVMLSQNSGKGNRTIEFDSLDTENATANTENLGTEGRLKRLWGGVAGSSENPMHSLQAIGQQASDTVFERVATRRVADANTKNDQTADYQIVDKLGEGAMGIVFSARQTGVNRIVAFKTAKPSYQKNDESRRRFLYEAHITADLDHSNIVPIYELGASEEGLLFYSMKMVSGTEWSRVIRKKSLEENIEIFMKVADAMAFAHSKGVIHRDLKPENTMLGKFGEVFVTDWGTAINIEKDSSTLAAPTSKGDRFVTVKDGSAFATLDAVAIHDGKQILEKLQIKQIDKGNRNRFFFRKKLSRNYKPSPRLKVVKVMNLAGTPCYMAPEMAGHDVALLGPRSDIYILGAMLFDIIKGHPPHVGESVTQCLRAALQNEIIQEETDDPLLAIAYRAMATHPDNRYQTVGELQDAVREYRKHAESIKLTERSDELFVVAEKNADYEAFSKTLFGYQDAIDLWDENSAAENGLKRARLAFGQVAFDKGDYDLVLQTVDTEVEVEKELHDQAVLAKKQAEGRESALKFMRKLIAAVVVFAVVGLSILTSVAFYQRSQAVAAKDLAEAAEKDARESAEKERLAKEEERLAKEKETQAKEEEKKARDEALKQRDEAERQRNKAIEAERQERLAKEEQIEANKRERKAKEEAQEQREIADKAKDIAEKRAAKIQLGEYNSALALAKSQIESFDLQAGRENLKRLKDLTSPVFEDRNPDFATWGWKRINLLSNQDLPGIQLPGGVTATGYSQTAGVVAIGSLDGSINVLQWIDDRLQILASYKSEDVATSLAVSNDGDAIAFTSRNLNDEYSTNYWSFKTQANPEKVVSAGNRQFQALAFSPSGSKLLAGINGGIWVWQCQGKWMAAPQPADRIQGARGRLQSLTFAGENDVLIAAKFNGSQLMKLLDLSDKSTRTIELPVSISLNTSTIGFDANAGTVFVGLEDKRILTATLDIANLRVETPIELMSKHGAAITQAAPVGIGRMLTSSQDEPVVHLWKETGEDWEYETYLTGTQGNVAGVLSLSEDKVLGVDIAGQTVVWDIDRQAQRQQVVRTASATQADSGLESYVAPVVEVVAGSSSGNALSIDANGVVDVWSLLDGSTSKIPEQRWSYLGHTPGAELVDSAIDLENGRVITVGSLRTAKRSYLTNKADAWEFCIWDLGSGNMIRRWSAPQRKIPDQGTESIEQRVSLLNGGQSILYSSDKLTRITGLDGETIQFSKDDFGSYFAVPHPSQSSVSMLVKRSGAVKVLDLENQSRWEDRNFEYYSLADPSDIPLQGVWSHDGRRFYAGFSSGGLACFEWDGAEVRLLWSSRSIGSSPEEQRLESALRIKGGKLQSHLDMDIAVTSNGSQEFVHMALRSRGVQPATSNVTVSFPMEIGAGQVVNPRLVNAERVESLSWLTTDANGSVQLSDRIHDLFQIDTSRIRSKLNAGGSVFVSTNSAEVYRFDDGKSTFASYGRSKLVSATGTNDGKQLYALFQDGAIWRFSLLGAEAAWNKLPYSSLGASQISVSPNGEELLVLGADQVALVDPDSGAEVRSLGQLKAFAWRPLDSALLVCDGQKKFQLFADGETRELVIPESLLTEQIESLHFINETWKNKGVEPRQHLLLHTSKNEFDRLHFLPLDRLVGEEEEVKKRLGEEDGEYKVTEVAKGSKVAVSPVESIILTAAPGGTVSVWFATPTWESNPRQLFDLEGHRGAEITVLAFSNDGKTVVTADSKNRLFAWLSEDQLTTAD